MSSSDKKEEVKTPLKVDMSIGSFKPSLNVAASSFVPSTAPKIEFSPIKTENP